MLYLPVGITGVIGMMVITPQIIVNGDAAASGKNILDKDSLFRTGIKNDFVSNTLFLVLVLVLYRLLKQVNKNTAFLMLVFYIIQVPVVFNMDAFNISSLMILKGE